MEKRIKIFSGVNPYEIEENINNFLENMLGKLHDVILDVAFDPHIDSLEYTGLLVYTPEGEDEKEGQRKEESRKSNEGIQSRRIAFREQGRACCVRS